MGRPKKIDKLSRDSTAAIAAGMSYGKYMAMKNTTFFVKPPEDEIDEYAEYRHTCLNCGKEFISETRLPRKYCSDYCRYEYYTKKKSLEYPQKKTCPICGKEFTAETFRNKYCNPFCSKVGHGQRNKEYRLRKAEEADHGKE